MQIEYIGHVLPARRITNDDVVDLIREHSAGFEGDLTQQMRVIKSLLHLTGARTRYWLADNESPRGLIRQACEQALETVDRAEIDLLIYCSIHTELIEPSNANLIAQEIGLDRVECFDIKAGCDGWMKAARIAQSLLASGAYKKIMVVAAEFPVSADANFVFPSLFKLKSQSQIDYTFPAWTVGETATATIFSAGEREWSMENKTRNDLCDLCTITPTWYGKYPILSERVAMSGPGKFTSFGADLFVNGYPELMKLAGETDVAKSSFDIIFTHASSKKDWMEICRGAGLNSAPYDIYSRYGNCVSASVPLSISDAVTQGKLNRGGRALIFSASAGMTFSLVQFTY